MSFEEKKAYLNSYAVYIAMAKRIRNMIKVYPDDAGRFIEKLKMAVMVCECIEDEIELVKPRLFSEVLAHKYLSGKRIEEIAAMMNYSKRQMERIHRQALRSFEPMNKLPI